MTSQSTLDLVRGALAKALDPNELNKVATFTQSTGPTTGLQIYDLEAPAKNLYPVLTPLRNRIPRVSGKGGIQANWKAVTAIDSTSIFSGVSEGRRGSVIGVTTKEYFAAYRTLGAESAVTYEADFASEGFDDLKARATQSMLQALMINEEKVILGGNTSMSLGITPTPTLVASTTGGAIATATVCSVIAVALTMDGYNRSNLVSGVQGVVARVTADGLSDTWNGGSAQKSTAASVTTGAGATNTVTATVAYVPGAFGYAWFMGPVGTERLAMTTPSNQAVLTAVPTTTQLASTLPAVDASANSLLFDGLLTMASNPTLGATVQVAAAGGTLTPDMLGGIVEFDAMLKSMWDNLRIAPDRITIGSQEMLSIRHKILTGNSSTNTRFTFNILPGQIVGGGMPKGYLNPFANSNGPAEIPIELHPYMPNGTVLFSTEKLPYPSNNINNIMQIRARRDYYQITWPQKTRQYEFGVYTDEVLQNYFIPALGLITNLSPG